MSLQLRIGKRVELRAIDVSFGGQFLAPLTLIVMMILGVSAVIENERAPVNDYAVSGADNSTDVDRLQREVANLEGESQRLKAFAKRMVSLAKLDKNTFDFDKPPARGGLGGRNIFQRYPSVSPSSVLNDVKALRKSFIEQSNQLERMQLILKSRILGESEKSLQWPVAVGYISSTFGVRKDPFTGRRRKHSGIDLAGPRGSAIFSVAKGVVLFTGRKGGYGRVIEIKHAGGVISRYAHLEASLVKKGQAITSGEKIARLGTSGRSTGPHLHLEIIKNKKNIDPLVFLGRSK